VTLLTLSTQCRGWVRSGLTLSTVSIVSIKERTQTLSSRHSLRSPQRSPRRALPVQEELPVIPLDVLVEQMVAAMIANPVYQITYPETAMAYLQANALTRLTATEDPLARGLLLGWERHWAQWSSA
jgi:hypothetical protein